MAAAGFVVGTISAASGDACEPPYQNYFQDPPSAEEAAPPFRYGRALPGLVDQVVSQS